MFSRISAPSNGSWSDPVPAVPAAPDIPGILSARECWTRIPKKAPGPGLPRGTSSIRLRIPWGWFLGNSGMCCPFQRLGKPRAFPKAPVFHQEPVPSSFSLDVGKNLAFPWEFSPVHKYYREWDLSGLEATWINGELSGMAPTLGFTSWQIRGFPDAVCRGMEGFGIKAGTREFPPKGRAGIALSQLTNRWIQQLLPAFGIRILEYSPQLPQLDPNPLDLIQVSQIFSNAFWDQGLGSERFPPSFPVSWSIPLIPEHSWIPRESFGSLGIPGVPEHSWCSRLEHSQCPRAFLVSQTRLGEKSQSL